MPGPTTIDLRARNLNRENALHWIKQSPGNAIGDVLVVEDGYEVISGFISSLRMFASPPEGKTDVIAHFYLDGFTVVLWSDFSIAVQER